MSEPLKETDRWCPHKDCPHIGPTKSCRDCRADYLKSRGIKEGEYCQKLAIE